jgi:hypothetical protein
MTNDKWIRGKAKRRNGDGAIGRRPRDSVGRKTRRAEDLVFRLDLFAPVLSRAVRVVWSDMFPDSLTGLHQSRVSITSTARLKPGAITHKGNKAMGAPSFFALPNQGHLFVAF